MESLNTPFGQPQYFQLLFSVTAKSFQSCPTLCDHIDGSPPGSPVPRILQARTLEWVAIAFSNAWKWEVKVKSLSRGPTLRYPMDCSLPGSSVHGIFQARVFEWGAIAFSVPTPYPPPASHLFLSFFPFNLSTSRQFLWHPRWKQLEKILQTTEILCEDKWTGNYRFKWEIPRPFALAILWSVGEKSLQAAFLC